MDIQNSEVKPIGGYFPLQIVDGCEYYPDLIKLNTSRNALGYILQLKKYTKIYVPYFTCEAMLEPLERLNVPYQFYSINERLEPIFDFQIGPTECFLYNNYFGLKQNTVKKLSQIIDNLIIDNAQAFFSEPIPEIDTFYSCRKFFGVPDGAYLQVNTRDRLRLESDFSADRFSHLIKSIDHGIERSYADFIENEKTLRNNGAKSMSRLTQAILCGVDYEAAKRKRIENFNFLHKNLSSVNEFTFEFPDSPSAMFYPLLISKAGVKEKLIEKKIFTPTYWPNVFRWTTDDMLEYRLARDIVHLPIDHRYDLEDMAYILTTLKKII